MIRPLGVVVFVYVLFFRSVGLYAVTRTWKPLEELGAVAHGTALASLVVIVLTFFYRQVSYSRLVALMGCWVFTTAFVALGRQLAKRWLPIFHRKPRLLVLGTGLLGTKKRQTDMVAFELFLKL